MSCMEKCCRADIGFQLMERMKLEGITPNVHIYNSAISACARSNLWEKGYSLFKEMDEAGVKRDVVTYNAVLDAVASQVQLGRRLFEEGVKKGFYARVSRLAKHWFELDLHFMSLGGGEIALGWWFEECLVPFMVNTDKLKDVKSISIVTGYGKTRTRGRREGDDGMRKRCKAMLRYMNINEHEQPNKGRIHIDMESFIEEVTRKGGKIEFDIDSYIAWRERETTVNVVPDVLQKIRARYKPEVPGSGQPPFTRIETDSTSPEYRRANQKELPIYPVPPAAETETGTATEEAADHLLGADYFRRGSYEESRGSFRCDPEDRRPSQTFERRDSRRDDDPHRPGSDRRFSESRRDDYYERRGSEYSRGGGPSRFSSDRRGSQRQSFSHYGPGEPEHRGSFRESQQRGSFRSQQRGSFREQPRGSFREQRGSFREGNSDERLTHRQSLRKEDHYGPSSSNESSNAHGPPRSDDNYGRRESYDDIYYGGGGGVDGNGDDRYRRPSQTSGQPDNSGPSRHEDSFVPVQQQLPMNSKDENKYGGSAAGPDPIGSRSSFHQSDGGFGGNRSDDGLRPTAQQGEDTQLADRKRGYSTYQSQQPARGYNLEPEQQKRRQS